MEKTISIPVYKTGSWTEEVEYLDCTTKLMDVELPKKVGYDDTEFLVNVPFEINLN